MFLSVPAAAELLGVDPSRVRQLLRSGDLLGEQVGRTWLVDADAVAHRAEAPGPRSRPMAPARAWGLLDLIGGGRAAWLTPQARSQVKRLGGRLVGGGPRRWAAALRGRSDVVALGAHPAALRRLQDDPRTVAAGVAAAVRAGLDLVVLDPLPEVYVRAEDLPGLARDLGLDPAPTSPRVIVRQPRAQWPFDVEDPPGTATLAADLLESREPRARTAGAAWLDAHVPERWLP